MAQWEDNMRAAVTPEGILTTTGGEAVEGGSWSDNWRNAWTPDGLKIVDSSIRPTNTLLVPRESNGILTDTSQSFMDWYGNGSFSNSTTTKKAGAGSATITTSNDGLQANFLREFTAVNLSTETLKIWVMSPDWSQIANAQIRVHTDYDNFFFANVKDRIAGTALTSGEWVEFHVPRSSFNVNGTPNWSSITCFSLVAWSPNGVSGVVHFNHVTRHPDGAGGVVSLTFDDGYSSQHEAAALMEAYGYVGTAYVIPTTVDTAGFMTEAQIQDLHDRGWDISGHTNAPLTGLSDSTLRHNLVDTSRWLSDRGFRGSGHYAYPNGAVDERVEAAVRRYFSTGRTINPSNQPLGNIAEHRLSAMSVYASQSDSEVQNLIDKAVANNEWLILCYHKIDTSGDDIAWTPTRFSNILTYIKNSGAKVKPMSAML